MYCFESTGIILHLSYADQSAYQKRINFNVRMDESNGRRKHPVPCDFVSLTCASSDRRFLAGKLTCTVCRGDTRHYLGDTLSRDVARCTSHNRYGYEETDRKRTMENNVADPASGEKRRRVVPSRRQSRSVRTTGPGSTGGQHGHTVLIKIITCHIV